MRRFIVAVVAVSSFAVIGPARAECVQAGEYDTVWIKIGNLEISGYQFGNFATGPAEVCSDGNAGTHPTTGLLSIRLNGVEVCHRTDTRVSADPFGFGIGIHAGPGSCGADVSLGTVMWPSVKPETITGAYAPGFDPVALADGGARAGLIGASPTEGFYWLDDGPHVALPPGHLGWYTRGVKVATS